MTDPAPTPETPEIPEKFRDPETGELRVEALLKSYLELERKLAGMVERPGPDAAPEALAEVRRALGVPDAPEGYAVEAPHDLIQPDQEVNVRLHDAGFTPEQVQLVYDLAADRLLPVLQEMAGAVETDRQMERLVAHFGGEEKWREVAGQLAAWGRRNLPPEVFESLSATYDGVLALHRMMANAEPGLGSAGAATPELSEEDLRRLMADPKYWRQRDAATVRQVQQGFQRLFPGSLGG